MSKYIKIIIAFALLVLIVSGCSKVAVEEIKENSFADLDYNGMTLSDLCDLIYENSEIDDITRDNIKTVSDDTTVNEQYYLDLDIISDYAIRETEGKFGVADVVILKVKDGKYEEAINSLELRKDDRINEFSNYDVLDSYTISQEAEIYQEKDLVIMLMLNQDSREKAMEIIEAYTLSVN